MEDLNGIKWFGHASFSFVDKNGNRIYYVDPFELKPIELERADLVFITHAHPDHFSPADLEKILTNTTLVIAPPDILRQIDIDEDLKFAVAPNKSYEIKNFRFQTIPAYNNRPEALQFHPKANRWVGYIFELNGKKIYHAGDTDFIDEMKSLKDLDLDVAMLPIGGHYTMDFTQAAEAANAIAAKITVPMHYRRMNSANYPEIEEKFKNLVTASEVVVLQEVA
jgi:L-ascorbate metabolism protein UlaG (beta-lactamase superfamily)